MQVYKSVYESFISYEAYLIKLYVLIFIVFLFYNDFDFWCRLIVLLYLLWKM